MKRFIKNARPWLVAVFLLLIWELSCRLFHIPGFILPAPTRIAEVTWQFRNELAMHSMQTLMTTIVGFLIAIVVESCWVSRLDRPARSMIPLYPLLVGFNSIPKVALVPLIVIWTGLGTIPAIVTAFALSFFPIVVNVATGLASVEPEMRDVLRILGASRYEMLRKVGLPRSLPYLFASLKISISLAFIGSVVSETIASNQGIGFLMLSASSRFQVALVFSGVIIIAIMSIAMYAICVQAERRLVGWAYRGQAT